MSTHTDTARPARGGRPPLSADEKLGSIVHCRMTTAELEHVRTQATLAGLSVSEFLRRRSNGYRIDPAPGRSFNPALIMEVNELGRQLKAAGNLANQLALSVHRGRDFSGGWRAVRDKVNEALADVTAALRKLTGADGS